MLPIKNNNIVKPIKSFMLILAIANKGNAQNGQTTFQILSPQATPIITFQGSTPSVAAAGNINGACTTQCPPAEGTKILIIKEDK